MVLWFIDSWFIDKPAVHQCDFQVVENEILL